jgi:hypothetical protein
MIKFREIERLQNEQLHISHSSLHIVGVNKSKCLRWADHVIRLALPPINKKVKILCMWRIRQDFIGNFLQAVGPFNRSSSSLSRGRTGKFHQLVAPTQNTNIYALVRRAEVKMIKDNSCTSHNTKYNTHLGTSSCYVHELGKLLENFIVET